MATLPPPNASTHELIAMARGGDPQALDALCRRYLPRLQRWARGRLPADSRSLLDTDDVIQETLIQVVRRLNTDAPEPLGTTPQGYLRQAIMNRIRDEVRRARRRPEAELTPDELPSPGTSPFEACVGQEMARRYEKAMSHLTERERTAIHLRVELDLPFAEVASAMGSPSTDAARMLVARALTRLAKEMGHEA